ncbi:D-alanyl-D-alanine carboxypeptidase family protein [Thiohalorhabdus sp. Cl-TMA]|uniref:serine-type D-Ala-D-Ala carboxypeptidase n=1 Tax=Thiohalorhabdus methylotrophus TaxID=3242694 RepID=A0ABV4TRQ1_9GAMM
MLAPALLAFAATASATPAPPDLNADASLLMATRSGRVLASEHPDKRYAPASLAKLMTAYLSFRALDGGGIAVTDQVRIREDTWRMSGAQMFLGVGETVSVDKLLQGLLVAGGNDAAQALARHVAGSVSGFVRMMNRQADALGMEHTRFANPSGIRHADQYTTARDMATLARALIRRFPSHYRRFRQQEITHNGITQRNRNRLLAFFEGADGLMTGYGRKAGYHLITSARRDRTRFLSVLLGAGSSEARFQDAMAALDYGFRFYETIHPYGAGERIREVRVWKGESDQVAAGVSRDLFLTIPRNRRDALRFRPEIERPLSAPIRDGERLGRLHVDLNGHALARRPLVAQHGVAWGGWMRHVVDTVRLEWKRFWKRQRRKLLAHDEESTGNGPPG